LSIYYNYVLLLKFSGAALPEMNPLNLIQIILA
jgi:hypothetical protein